MLRTILSIVYLRFPPVFLPVRHSLKVTSEIQKYRNKVQTSLKLRLNNKTNVFLRTFVSF
jgi:hypothetical protein